MKYFFVLGNNPALSVAEISAVINFKSAQLLAKNFLIIECEQELNPSHIIKTLGGSIKIGLIKNKFNRRNWQKIKQEIISLVKTSQISSKSKFNFGFSEYGSSILNTKELGLDLKKKFKLQAISARFVISKEKNLSSVVVERNKLLTKGLEIVIVANKEEAFIGQTLAVQAFRELSRRDYGRPARDDRSGMLPPKLAQIMLNLAQIEHKSACLLDPFCGSGTVISEAILAGFNNLIASDISPKAIGDTKKNVAWLRELENITKITLKLAVKNVLDLTKFVKKNSVDAIVTEPYLGPQRGNFSVDQISKELEELYSQALEQFRIVLKPKARVVMVWPIFYGHQPIKPNYQGFELIDMLAKSLKFSQYLKKNIRPTIIYGRPGQKIYREIVVLQKK